MHFNRIALVLAPCAALLLVAAAEVAAPNSLSPDRRYAAIVDPKDAGRTLMILDRQSGKVRTKLRLGGRKFFPVFSPDGYFVAFYVQFANDEVLTVTDLTGHSWPVATVRGAIESPLWSANAEYLFFSSRTTNGDRDIFRVTAGGTHLTNLTQSPDQDEIAH